MATITDPATLDGGAGPEAWFGVAVSAGETPTTGHFAMSGDITTSTLAMAIVITCTVESAA